MTDKQDTPSVAERITAYLSTGGLFNPELANHDAVRDLLIDARAELTALRAKLAAERDKAEWALHNGGLLREWALEWRPSICKPLIEYLRDRRDADIDSAIKSTNVHLK